MRIRYNAPVTLTFSIAAAIVLVIDGLTGAALTGSIFSVPPQMGFDRVIDYARLFTHSVGHAGWDHLIGNLAFILLLGPILEEKYGPAALAFMMIVTAGITGILNILFLSTGLLGASGIVFMMIMLVCFTRIRQGEIPLTFILIVLLYLTREFVAAFGNNNVSQFAHIIGGLCGSMFGFLRSKGRISG